MPGAIAVLIVIALVVLFSSLRMCSEWQRKVVLRLGRFTGVRGPGIFFLLPFAEQTPYTIDLRTVTSSFTAEQTLTKDNVPVNVDTIVFWRVIDPAKAVLQVQNYTAAVLGSAQTSLRDVIGKSDLAQVLSQRQDLDTAMTDSLDAQTEPWGIKVLSVQMRDIKIPDMLQEAMSRVAQADRERQARLVLGDSEVQIAQRFADAGHIYDTNPMGLHLRGMNMLYEVMKGGNSSTVIVPSSAVESMTFGSMAGLTALAKEQQAAAIAAAPSPVIAVAPAPTPPPPADATSPFFPVPKLTPPNQP